MATPKPAKSLEGLACGGGGLLLRSLIALLALVTCWGCRQSRDRAEHVVLLVVDTLRADHLGFMGYERPVSPRLDELAKGSLVFERSYSTSSWTVPAVASLFSSRWTFEHRAGVSGPVVNLHTAGAPAQFDSRLETLPKALREAGFRTALLSANPYLYGEFKSGFEVAEIGRRSAEELTDRALAWLDETGSERSFLYVHYMDVHEPNAPLAELVSVVAPEVSGADPGQHGRFVDPYRAASELDSPELIEFRRRRIAVYDAAIRSVDQQLGRLIDRLESGAHQDSTLLVVTADHGEEFWEHAAEGQAWADDPRGYWGVGHGHTLFEELLRIPMVVRVPGQVRGTRVDCPASLVDVAPSVLAELGLPVRESFRGTKLWSPERIEPFPCRAERLLFAGSPGYGPASLAVISGRHKIYRRGDRPALAFDLEKDPEERVPLPVEETWAVALSTVLGRAWDLSSDSQISGGPYSVEQELQLRALGYLP